MTMSQSLKIRTRVYPEYVDVKVLLQHEMETGLRKDERTGEMIPAHFIQLVEVALGGRPVLSMQWGVAVSQNPYLGFRLKHAAPGDVLSIQAIDNRGESIHGEAIIS
jgi:sulfur-oxidizing protein SoxZ